MLILKPRPFPIRSVWEANPTLTGTWFRSVWEADPTLTRTWFRSVWETDPTFEIKDYLDFLDIQKFLAEYFIQGHKSYFL